MRKVKGSASTTGWRLDGNALGATLIHIAVGHSEGVSLEKHSQVRFVREFLVLCRFGFGIVGVKNRIARSILVGIDEEFARFNPEYDDLLEARVHHYFKTIEHRPPDSDWIHCVVDDWARRVDVPTNVAPWAFGVFLEATMVFRELIGSDSASIQ